MQTSLLHIELFGHVLSSVQLIITPPLPLVLVEVPANRFPSGTPFVQVFVLFLHIDPAGQSLFLLHRYSHKLFVQDEPNGQLLSLVQEYEHKLLLQAEPLGQLVSPTQLATPPPLED